MRYFIRLRYKGTTYHGWQIQNNAHTVQESVDRALSLALRFNVETLGWVEPIQVFMPMIFMRISI